MFLYIPQVFGLLSIVQHGPRLVRLSGYLLQCINRQQMWIS